MRLHYSSMRVAFKADAVRAKVSRDLGFSHEDRVVWPPPCRSSGARTPALRHQSVTSGVANVSDCSSSGQVSRGLRAGGELANAEIRIEAAQRGDEAGGRKPLLIGPAPRGCEPFPKSRVSEECLQRAREGSDVARQDEQRVAPVGHVLGNAIARARDDRGAGS